MLPHQTELQGNELVPYDPHEAARQIEEQRQVQANQNYSAAEMRVYNISKSGPNNNNQMV